MQPNKIMYIDLPDPLPKSYAPKKGEEMNRSTYSTMRYTIYMYMCVYVNTYTCIDIYIDVQNIIYCFSRPLDAALN